MNKRFAILCSSFLYFAVLGGESADSPPTTPLAVPSQDAAEYLKAAINELHGGINAGFSSKADYISSDDQIDAGVVHEGPETGLADNFEDALAAAVLDRAEYHGYEHSRHAQMIQTQHKSAYGQQQPTSNQQPPHQYQQPSPVYHHQPPADFPKQPPTDYLPQQMPSTSYVPQQKPPSTSYTPQQKPPSTNYGTQQQPPDSYIPQEPSNNYLPQQPPTEYHPQPPTDYQPQPPTDYQPQPPQSDYLPQTHPHVQDDSIPPLSKEELAALYEAALQKGSHLDLAKLPGGVESLGEPSVGAMPGYYYYYYPIKQFPKKEEGDGGDGQKGDGNGDDNSMGNSGEKQMVEPLFVAVAAFMGVSIIFMFSLLFLPKVGFLKKDGIGFLSRFAPDDLSGLTRVVLESVDGKDCDQRIACELGSVLRKLRMHDRPLRMLEVMLSKPAQKHIQDVRRAAIYRTKCNAIRCKRKQRET